MMNILIEWIAFISRHNYLSNYISGLVFEDLLAVNAALTAKGDVHLWVIFVFGFLGTVSADLFWFHFIKIKPFYAIAKRLSDWERKKAKINILPDPRKLHNYIIFKMLGGLRVWSTLYCSIHDMPLKKFIINSMVSTAVWLIIFIPLARTIGKSALFVLHLTRDIGLFVIIAIGVYILFIFMSRFLLKEILKSEVSYK